MASFALSLLAWQTSSINRDGMLYVDTARIFLEQGFTAAKMSFAWPFISIFIAGMSKVTGLPLEAAGYLMNALFMAGATGFLVDAANRRNPQAAWMTCLVALAMPGINEYRNELLREFGCWFFIMAAFWMAQRWAEEPGWAKGLVIQVLIGMAALFRPEAVAMIPALLAWQWFSAPGGGRFKRLMMIGGAACAGLLALLLLYFGGRLVGESRLHTEFSRISIARFNAKAEAMSGAFIEYARSQARTILFFGSLAIIPIKLISKLGLLLVPLLFVRSKQCVLGALRQYDIFAWGFAAHITVLVVFVLDLQFLAGRYVGLLLLCATPFVGLATWQLMQRHPRWRHVILATLLTLMIVSTLSLNSGKTNFRDAGHWLAQNVTPAPDVFVGSGRSAYYAGWGYSGSGPTAEILSATLRDERFALYVLDVGRDDIALRTQIERSGLLTVHRFGEPRGSEVVVLARPNQRFQPTGVSP